MDKLILLIFKTRNHAFYKNQFRGQMPGIPGIAVGSKAENSTSENVKAT